MKGSGDKRAVRRIVVDAALAACFVAVMATALVQEAPHEYLGVALVVLVAVHAVQHRRWFTALFKGRYNVLRILQIAMLAGLFVCIVGQIASALVLSEHAFSFLPVLPGAAWARQVHMLCSYWAFVFAFAHAGLQTKSVLRRIGRKLAPKPHLMWVARVAVGAVAIFGAVSFVQLGMADYLLARVQFAAADYSAPLALTCARYAAMALLIGGLFHCLRVLLELKTDEGGKERG